MPSTPTIKHCRLEGAGEAWDAVRVPRSVGNDAVSILGSLVGAALQDPHEGCMYFFIAPRVGGQVGAPRCARCPNPRAWRSRRVPAAETNLWAWPVLAGLPGRRQAPH